QSIRLPPPTPPFPYTTLFRSPGERLTTVPAALSAIILKLLSKTAEERYQTAAGIEADLGRCLVEWESQGRIGTFSLGSHDTSDRDRKSTRLNSSHGSISYAVF